TAILFSCALTTLHLLSLPTTRTVFLFFVTLCPLPRRTFSPYTTLFRSPAAHRRPPAQRARHGPRGPHPAGAGIDRRPGRCQPLLDRKSTRLNSSHVSISYDVFCLKMNTYKPSA